MEFHLPYITRRRKPIDNIEIDDPTVTNRPSRTTEKVILMGFGASSESGSLKSQHDDTESEDYIFEAQTSVLVTGLDNWFWTAYCFSDTYHKSANYHESVQHYSKENRDLISCGELSLDHPVWDPRDYFLRILSYRMQQVKEEWSNSVSQLLQQTGPYVRFTLSPLSQIFLMDQDIQVPGGQYRLRQHGTTLNHRGQI